MQDQRGDEQQHGVSIQISINLGKKCLHISCLWKIALTLSLCIYLLSLPRFWVLSVERFWFLFWSILNVAWRPEQAFPKTYSNGTKLGGRAKNNSPQCLAHPKRASSLARFVARLFNHRLEKGKEVLPTAATQTNLNDLPLKTSNRSLRSRQLTARTFSKS